MKKYWLYAVLFVLRPVLWSLEKVFELTRTQVKPAYPYNAQTQTIVLPLDVQDHLYQRAITGQKPQAIKEVAQLTGAGLRLSKTYVDRLLADRGTQRKAM